MNDDGIEDVRNRLKERAGEPRRDEGFVTVSRTDLLALLDAHASALGRYVAPAKDCGCDVAYLCASCAKQNEEDDGA